MRDMRHRCEWNSTSGPGVASPDDMRKLPMRARFGNAARTLGRSSRQHRGSTGLVFWRATLWNQHEMARPEGVEPPTFWFVVGEVNLVSCGLSCPYKLS